MIIAVLGQLSVTEAELLGGLRSSGTTCLGLLIDATSWRPPPDFESDPAHEAAAVTLLRSGWRLIGVSHGASLAALWPQAGRGTQGFALRATMAETVSRVTTAASGEA